MYRPKRTSDLPQASVYRVTVEFNYELTDHMTKRTGTHYGHARVNVFASSPTAAQEWLLDYPHEASLPTPNAMNVINAYKLKRQPVWLRKLGKRGARFDVRELWLGHIESSPKFDMSARAYRAAYRPFNYVPQGV